MPEDLDLRTALRRYWGYDSFRPLQERIVHSLLNGKDVAVVMPTGGGKSLCYQLPALVSGGRTVVVISPLIALMQDQAAQLAQMGIPAAVLNSALPSAEQSEIRRNACQGAYRLLYLSPERLARADTIGWLQRVPLAFFAIDEAHCISEWGHEFRPEYRQLSALRQNFPDRPIAAFTASATQRVRHDILDQLQLRDPDKYIVSFHRPNLRYVVHHCANQRAQQQLLVKALRAYAGSNVIVYAPTIARVEETVETLAEKRISAIPYHGKMESETRRRNQERWMSDEIRVLVGTLAFGLGINKAAVRAVIHLAMPKSVEQYYQEAGRAGRDGEPADCLLFWQAKDAIVLRYFIDKLENPEERERAWQRYHAMRRFAESRSCRHRQICLHFGEKPKWERCGACDVCGALPDWMRAPDVEKPEPVKRERPKLSLERVPVAPTRRPAGDELLEYMREWRRKLAHHQGIPAFMVLNDASLEDLCHRKPATLRELLRVNGIGERKAEMFGEQIFAALDAFARGARAAEMQEVRSTPAEETIALLEQGKSLDEIARVRNRQLGTVVGMVADLVEKGRIEFQPAWVRPEVEKDVVAAIGKHGMQWLKPLRAALPGEVSDEEIRLVVAKMRRSSALAERM